MKIGNKIKNLRIENKMTQEELANELYVTRNAISKWENDKGLPNIDSLILLTKIFNISLDSLFSNEEIVKLALSNNDKKDFNRNLIYATINFFIFALIGILIPIIFKYDPTAGLAVYLIILPLAYVIIGVISALFSAKWPYIVISSALAITPIYTFSNLNVRDFSIGFIPIIYYLLYLASYFLIIYITKKTEQRYDSKRLSKLFLIGTITLITVYLIHTSVQAITTYNDISTSAPWYVPVILNTVIYIVPVTILTTLYLYFRRRFANKRWINAFYFELQNKLLK